MLRSLPAILTTLTISLAASAPALAADSATTTTTAGTKGATKTTSAASSGNMATRLVSTVAGSVVGIPVSMVRRSRTEVVVATKELVGDHKWAYAVVAPISVPGGIISGMFQGLVYGPYNAWKYSNEPFSAQSFSLGNLDK